MKNNILAAPEGETVEETQVCSDSGAAGGQPASFPTKPSFDGVLQAWGWRQMPIQGPRCPGCPLCVKNTALLVHPSPQTVCIEKIPAHLVSFLLLLASAGTICGLKRHALKDRKEDEKEDTGGEQEQR